MPDIVQCLTSCELLHFKDHFMRNHGLLEYSDKTKPAVFYGCYNQNDYNAINQHLSTGIVVWGGSDIMNKVLLRKLSHKNHIKHVARSDFIIKDLESSKVSASCYRKIPLISTNIRTFCATPKQNKIYTYLTANHKVRQDDLYNKIKFRLQGKFKFIEINPKTKMPQDDFDKLLDQCFIGLRLVNHDGLSNTVVELGLKGRKCLWNGGLPNSIPYKNIDDIIDSIYSESSKIGEIDQKLSDKTKDYVNVGNEWLTEEYWNE